MNKKAILAIEIIWIILGFLCLLITIRELFITKGEKAWIFGLMTVGAFTLAWMRDRQRKKS
jgi:hypothetical protein